MRCSARSELLGRGQQRVGRGGAQGAEALLHRARAAGVRSARFTPSRATRFDDTR